jgi:hypothetical protein
MGMIEGARNEYLRVEVAEESSHQIYTTGFSRTVVSRVLTYLPREEERLLCTTDGGTRKHSWFAR